MREIPLPENIRKDLGIEVARVWMTTENQTMVIMDALRLEEPLFWALVLADLAHHLVDNYSNIVPNFPREKYIKDFLRIFNEEMSKPTAEHTGFYQQEGGPHGGAAV